MGQALLTTVLVTLAALGLFSAVLAALLYQVVRQQGRLLLRLDQVERRLGLDPGDSIERGTVALRARSGPRASLATRPLTESRIERNGLAPGTPAPAFVLPAAHGGRVSLEEYRGRKVLLVFSDPHCGPCEELSPHLARVAGEHRGNGLAVLVVGRGDAGENRSKAERHGWEFPVALQRHWEISRRYGIFATPVAFLIDEHGVIEQGVARGVAEILALVPGEARPGKGAAACG